MSNYHELVLCYYLLSLSSVERSYLAPVGYCLDKEPEHVYLCVPAAIYLFINCEMPYCCFHLLPFSGVCVRVSERHVCL